MADGWSILGSLAGVVVGAAITGGRDWLTRKRRLSGQWDALKAELSVCADLAETYRSDRYKAPAYRLPTFVFDAAFPVLITESEMPGSDAGALLRFYGLVGDVNRGLDAAADAAASGDSQRLDNERNRLLAKVGRLTVKDEASADSLYREAIAVARRRRP
jgi:hypothetical protein